MSTSQQDMEGNEVGQKVADIDVGSGDNSCVNVLIEGANSVVGAVGDDSSVSVAEISDSDVWNTKKPKNKDQVKTNPSPVRLDSPSTSATGTGDGDKKKEQEKLDEEMFLLDTTDSEDEGTSSEDSQEKSKTAVDRWNDWIMPGLYRTIIAPSEENDEIDLLYAVAHFPNKGSFVEVLVKGLKEDEVIFPERTLEYFIGDGFLEGLPIGVDAALTHFRRGESSLLTITERDLLQPIFPELMEEPEFGSDISISYFVTLKKFQNLPLVPEEYSMDDRLVLCDRLNIAANKLFNATELTKALSKWDFIRKNMENEFLVKQVPEDFDVKRLGLLLKALVGMGTCLLKLEDPLQPFGKLKLEDIELVCGKGPLVYAERAQTLKPDSVDALLLLAEINLSRKEPQKALDLFNKVHELQPNRGDIRAQIEECIRLLKEQKALAMGMATRMLGLNIN